MQYTNVVYCLKKTTEHLLSERAIMRSTDTSVNHTVKGLTGECGLSQQNLVPLRWRNLCWL